jgi:hypothetical protein
MYLLVKLRLHNKTHMVLNFSLQHVLQEIKNCTEISECCPLYAPMLFHSTYVLDLLAGIAQVMHAHTYIQYIYCDAKQADAQNPYANSAPPLTSHTGGLAIMQLKLAPLDISHIPPPHPHPHPNR